MTHLEENVKHFMGNLLKFLHTTHQYHGQDGVGIAGGEIACLLSVVQGNIHPAEGRMEDGADSTAPICI